MNAPVSLPPRSPELLAREGCALLVIDVQEKLVPAIPGRTKLIWNIRRLCEGAALLNVPISVSEQYPQGLGPTIAELRELPGMPAVVTKTMFSCRECTGLLGAGIRNVLLCGIETHVCVLQTALDLLHAGVRPWVAVDAVASRGGLDHEIALRRMERAGVGLLTVESALFEWCERAGTPEFKGISALVRRPPPTE